MKISEIHIQLVPHQGTSRLLAYATIVFDDMFSVQDVKLIDGRGGIFVSMPSRGVREQCVQCRTPNNVWARYCNACGAKVEKDFTLLDRRDCYKDLAHPINEYCRRMIHDAVTQAYYDELKLNEPVEVFGFPDEQVDVVKVEDRHG